MSNTTVEQCVNYSGFSYKLEGSAKCGQYWFGIHLGKYETNHIYMAVIILLAIGWFAYDWISSMESASDEKPVEAPAPVEAAPLSTASPKKLSRSQSASKSSPAAPSSAAKNKVGRPSSRGRKQAATPADSQFSTGSTPNKLGAFNSPDGKRSRRVVNK